MSRCSSWRRERNDFVIFPNSHTFLTHNDSSSTMKTPSSSVQTKMALGPSATIAKHAAPCPWASRPTGHGSTGSRSMAMRHTQWAATTAAVESSSLSTVGGGHGRESLSLYRYLASLLFSYATVDPRPPPFPSLSSIAVLQPALPPPADGPIGRQASPHWWAAGEERGQVERWGRNGIDESQLRWCILVFFVFAQ